MESEILKNIKMMMKSGKEQTGGLQIPTLEDDYMAIQSSFEEQNLMMPYDKNVEIVEKIINGVKVERITPEVQKGDAIILHIHGGGMALGSPATSRTYTTALSNESGFIVYSVDYGLAPQNLFPKAPNDCFAVYEGLLEMHKESELIILGESAGGNLTLATTVMIIEKGLKKPACIVPFCPLTTLAERFASETENAERDIVIPSNAKEMVLKSYVKNEDLFNPKLSPLYAELSEFPPMKIVVDESEILKDDSVALYEKALSAGTSVEIEILEGTFHGISNMARMAPESYELLKRTIAFINNNLG